MVNGSPCPPARPRVWRRTHPGGRTYPYLFWEAEQAGWTLDRARATLVGDGQATSFLERVCDAYALTDRECADLVTYWMPEMSRHPYVIVQLVDRGTWDARARLQIDPAPDTVVRLFMLLEPTDTPVATGDPALPRHERHGFTAVEWGGAWTGP